MVVETNALCDDAAFIPPKTKESNKIQCHMITPDDPEESKIHVKHVEERHNHRYKDDHVHDDTGVIGKKTQGVDAPTGAQPTMQLDPKVFQLIDKYLQSREQMTKTTSSTPSSHETSTKEATWSTAEQVTDLPVHRQEL